MRLKGRCFGFKKNSSFLLTIHSHPISKTKLNEHSSSLYFSKWKLGTVSVLGRWLGFFWFLLIFSNWAILSGFCMGCYVVTPFFGDIPCSVWNILRNIFSLLSYNLLYESWVSIETVWMFWMEENVRNVLSSITSFYFFLFHLLNSFFILLCIFS